MKHVTNGGIMGARTKAAALLVSLPIACLMAFGSAGAAFACPTGSTSTTINNTPVCVPNGDGGVGGGGTGTVGSGGSTTPGQAQPIVGGTGNTAPIMPPAAPAPMPAAPAPVYKAPVPAAPAPVQNHAPVIQAPAPAQKVAPAAVAPAQGTATNAVDPESAVPAASKPETKPAPSASANAPAASSSPVATPDPTATPSPSVSETPATGVTYVDRASESNAAAPVFIALIAGLLVVGAALLFKFKRKSTEA